MGFPCFPIVNHALNLCRRLLYTPKGLVNKYLKHDECYDLVYDGDGDDQW